MFASGTLSEEASRDHIATWNALMDYLRALERVKAK
jgi:hypothetical protein